MNEYQNNLTVLQDKYHSKCFFNFDKFETDYYFKKDGTFVMHFFCQDKYQGYDNILHGGVISALIDSAMTKCLFGHSIIAYTVRLNLKYLRSVNINEDLLIRVSIGKNTSKIVELNAVVFQENKKKVFASAKFWKFDLI
jgi:acyl-coenzyme A thioesterase PaaI-like protein